MPQGTPPQDPFDDPGEVYYDPDDFESGDYDPDGYDPDGYDLDDYQAEYLDYDETDEAGVYGEVYERAVTHAEDRLDRRPPRPRARKITPPAVPAPPGWARALWLRWEEPVRRFAITAAAIGLVLSVFYYFMVRPGPDEDAAQAPLAAGPVERCANWPADVPLAAHTLPALIKGTLSAPGQRQGYQFRGEAGETWSIAVEPRGDSFLDPLLHLYDAAGNEVATADDRAAQDFSAELTFRLPEDGAYCLLVESSQGGLTAGAYLLSGSVQR